MQAIYYPISSVTVDQEVDKELTIISNHDEYCLWFDVRKTNHSTTIKQIPMPTPKSGIHLCISRTRLGKMNDNERNTKYANCLLKLFSRFVHNEQKLPEGVLCLSDITLLPLIAGAVVSKLRQTLHTNTNVQIFVCELKPQMKDIITLYQEYNKQLFDNVEIVFLEMSPLEMELENMLEKVRKIEVLTTMTRVIQGRVV